MSEKCEQSRKNGQWLTHSIMMGMEMGYEHSLIRGGGSYLYRYDTGNREGLSLMSTLSYSRNGQREDLLKFAWVIGFYSNYHSIVSCQVANPLLFLFLCAKRVEASELMTQCGTVFFRPTSRLPTKMY